MNCYFLPTGLVILFAMCGQIIAPGSVSSGPSDDEVGSDTGGHPIKMKGRMLFLSSIQAPGKTFGKSTAVKVTLKNERFIVFASEGSKQTLNPQCVMFIKYIESVEYNGGVQVKVQYSGKWMQNKDKSPELAAVEAAPEAGDKINIYRLMFANRSDASYFVESFVRKMAAEIGHEVRFTGE